MRLFVDWALLLGLAILGAFYLQSSGLTQRLDYQLLDTLSPLSRPAKSDDIVIVAFDDTSLEAVGAWPWPRGAHADLVDRLTNAGAKMIVLDVLFPEPSVLEEDSALAEAMTRADNVLLPHTFVARQNVTSGVEPLYPISEFEQAAAQIGHAVAEPDSDGVLRRFDLTLATDQGEFPHIALLASNFDRPAGSSTTTERVALIPFQPVGSYVQHSASELLAGAIPDEFFEGKTVLIGATAQGMGDRYSVAAGDVGLMTGIETQANLLNALTHDALIRPVEPIWLHVASVVALFILFLAFWFLSPRIGFALAIVLISGFLLISVALLAMAQLWFPVSAAIIVIAMAYPLWSWRRLSYVSGYLDREASRLLGSEPKVERDKGMEYVARQIDRLRGLVSSIEGSLGFIRQVIETTPDAILVLDAQQRVQMLNGEAARMFPGWNAADHPLLTELFLTSGAALQNDGNELITAGGNTYLVAGAPFDLPEQNRTGVAQADPRGSVQELPFDTGSGMILALREITELRRMDEERNQMLEFLSHDMRTPQVAIIGLTRKEADRAQSKDTMTRIRDQASRTLKLADDFVQLARLETASIQIEDSDIGALIEEACDRAFVQAEAKRIQIDQTLPQEPCFADVDPSLIARMLDNLIGNAVKYSEADGSIEVALTQATPETLTISVSDNGPGLPEARLDNPFARFGAHKDHAGPSAGLGLALVKKVVDAHGGSIEVTSKPGHGTQFTATFSTLGCEPV